MQTVRQRANTFLFVLNESWFQIWHWFTAPSYNKQCNGNKIWKKWIHNLNVFYRVFVLLATNQIHVHIYWGALGQLFFPSLKICFFYTLGVFHVSKLHFPHFQHRFSTFKKCIFPHFKGSIFHILRLHFPHFQRGFSTFKSTFFCSLRDPFSTLQVFIFHTSKADFPRLKARVSTP